MLRATQILYQHVSCLHTAKVENALQACLANRTMAQLDLVIGCDTTPHTFEMRLPQQAFSMLCSLCYLQEQVGF